MLADALAALRAADPAASLAPLDADAHDRLRGTILSSPSPPATPRRQATVDFFSSLGVP